MSLFVAVRPDAAAVEDLEDAVARVRRQPAAQGLHWQAPSRWHITVAFLGDGDVAAAHAVAERLVETRPPLVRGLRLSGAGCFGRQVLWVGLADGSSRDALTAQATGIPGRLRGLGLTVDRRPWRAHLTVARSRGDDARPAARLLSGYAGPPWDATELLVVQSSGGPSPAHRVLHSLPAG